MKKIALFTLISMLLLGIVLISGCSNEEKDRTSEATNVPQATIYSTLPSSPVFTPRPGNIAALSAPDIVVKVEPSVVAIITKWKQWSLFGSTNNQDSGTGIIFTSDGYILTNNHVVENAGTITVVLDNNERYPATLTGRQPMTDLAVIKINPKSILTPATFGDSDALRKGDYVLAIGNALALPGGPTVTDGIVSNLGRAIETEKEEILYDLIQTDAAINPGNSGGPLVNIYGEVVGINTAIASEAENIGFAISSASAIPIRDALVATGKAVLPFMGVGLDDLTPAVASQMELNISSGALLTRISPDYPADKAGLKVNDVITFFDNKPVNSANQLTKLIRQHKVGDTVSVTFVRKNDTRTAKLTLVERPEE